MKKSLLQDMLIPMMLALAACGIVWTAQTLDEYLAAPTRRVPGTRMTLATHDPTLRQAIIEYLSPPTP